MGGQVGCEQRIEVFVKIQKRIKKNWGGEGSGGGGGLGVRVDVTEQKSFCENLKKKNFVGGGVGLGGGIQVGWGGQGGCERRIEVFVKIQKKKILGGGGFGGGGVGGLLLC